MARTLFVLLLSLVISLHSLAATRLKEKLAQLKDIASIETINSEFAEKYILSVKQPLSHKDTSKGAFMQRVVVCHAGFDRPTVIITEGYGGGYALNSGYRDELSRLLNTNIVFVEHRFFQKSTPDTINWTYLTAENSAFDLHHVRTLFKDIYPQKWISSGISKGGQTTMIYRAFFPDDVDISVPYVAPLCCGVEDGRHEAFLRKVGTRAERRQIKNFQLEALKRKEALLPMMEEVCASKGLKFRIPLTEVFDYCVLEYSFAFWQWGTSFASIPKATDSDSTVFAHLADIAGPEYFSEEQSTTPFFVQAARELGYYGYDIRPFSKYMSIRTTEGYLSRIMLPRSALSVTFDDALYHKIYSFLKENDPRMIFIYGETDPWSAVHAPVFKGKVNEQVFFQPRGSHRTRISSMPERMRQKIVAQLNAWLEEN
ncbi:MAG: aminopeptidase [Tannerellaceae bacterium]|jgi:hypothetical protein|nr:aminopeptidase [Tannerellaceae bacterium]